MSELPSFAVYNVNWMSLCDQTRRNAKLHLLRDMLRRFDILGVWGCQITLFGIDLVS